jgi:hypothetical protein
MRHAPGIRGLGVAGLRLALPAACLIAMGWGVSAQEAPRGPAAGVKAGLSLSQHYGTRERDAEYEVSSRWRTSFAAGATLLLPITERFGLQHEVVYVRKGSRQRIGVEVLDVPAVLEVTYDLEYVEIPVLLRYAWRLPGRPGVYGLSGFALSLKTAGHYALSGSVDDGEQVVPLRADAGVPEVDGFDYSFVYGMGAEWPVGGRTVELEYRFTIGWNPLPMPTYACVPFGDEEILIDNPPVPLRNQSHWVTLGVRF